MFCTVSLTEKIPQEHTSELESRKAVSSRFVPLTVTCVAEALQLLLSFVSGTTRVSSEQDSKKYVPPAVPALTVTATVPLDYALSLHDALPILPVSRRAPLFEVVVDR